MCPDFTRAYWNNTQCRNDDCPSGYEVMVDGTCGNYDYAYAPNYNSNTYPYTSYYDPYYYPGELYNPTYWTPADQTYYNYYTPTYTQPT
jgi:hypothetical protein